MAGTPLKLDWDQLLPGNDHGPLPELAIVPPDPPQKDNVNSDPLQKDNVEYLSDRQLDEKIQRMQGNMSMMLRLPDKGAKYQACFKQLEAERERRKLQRLQKDADECEKPMQSQSSSLSGASHAFSPKQPTPNSHSQSFGQCFTKRLDDKSGSCTRDAFDSELRYFGRGKHKNGKRSGKLATSERQGTMMSSRPVPFRCPSSLSTNIDRHGPTSGNHKVIASSSYSTLHPEENLSSHFSKKRISSPVQTSRDLRSRKVQTVVLLDEEDVQTTQPKQLIHQVDKAEEWIKDTKIYYPSRNDPECVELCGSDMECLSPESPLSSTIMNFYIRYLQRPISPTGRLRGDYHFFNTYFYKKLEEAISNKRSDKDMFYAKFRRWWKGINIFQKAYIFLPIHADYLREEWTYLKTSIPPQDVPIPNKIWNKLSRRIAREIITVPQQKNDYDCGLFVLYFMERFIEEAPERLKRKNLSMFGRKWFKPEDASELRERIKNLLCEQFESARLENGGTVSPSSEGGASPGKSGGQCMDT
ncbi:ubiquitin-like-specific protease 1D isoform X2 [Magnolia sinica]|uniref:ubiquitin-like-specific protease 1D isoform X2 n=1 Tax=Magnolia sinica TaxID=86752 RepID=UPI002658EB86|nr:ubiquitin-like-specific protease 1D isoform X2 [Magnolia sinica]